MKFFHGETQLQTFAHRHKWLMRRYMEGNGPTHVLAAAVL